MNIAIFPVPSNLENLPRLISSVETELQGKSGAEFVICGDTSKEAANLALYIRGNFNQIGSRILLLRDNPINIERAERLVEEILSSAKNAKRISVEKVVVFKTSETNPLYNLAQKGFMGLQFFGPDV